MKILNVVIGGIAGLLLLGLPLSVLNGSASIGNTGGANWLSWIVGGAVGGAVLGLFASSIGKTLRYIFLSGAVVILVAPLASCFSAASLIDKQGAAVAAVVGIGSMFVGFFAFFAAAIYLVIGLLIGRDSAPKKAVVTVDAPTPETHVRCPDCAELVRKEATKCRHCGCVLVAQP
mgnify:CR=1 FL=1